MVILTEVVWKMMEIFDILLFDTLIVCIYLLVWGNILNLNAY